MDTSKLRKFASFARSTLIEQVGTRLKTVLAEKSLARRESPKVVEELERRIKDLGEKRVLEMVAYTWFNRFCALRYMDVNRYTRIGVLSPAEGQFQPEILAEAKMGHIDEELVPEATRKQVMRLLDGSDKSSDPQGEAYRLLLVAVCNYYYSMMPYMFERIADYTELLLPDDLLSGTSIPAYTREALLPINCSPEHTEESVEVIGWLYQFYITDKKDEVFDGLKKGKKIAAENIPAATQLFTPHWIVRYLVENSLGRLWILNHPDSKLIELMDYYIKPEEPDTDFLKISSPEEIKVCDPACGSGHMLTYAFDLLYEIYREEQYPEPEIPLLILKNNLYGIEIDNRAGALAAFALTMKAREKDKRFFTRKPQPDGPASDSFLLDNPSSKIQNPNICVLENIKIDADDLSAYMDKVGRDLFTSGLQSVVNQWQEADNFGSLIRPPETDLSEVRELFRERQMGQDLFLAKVHQQIIKAILQSHYLSPRYHVVVANPPYMGGKGMTLELKDFADRNFPDSKSDLYSMFAERCYSLAVPSGYFGLMTPFTWMFLGSQKGLRRQFIEEKTVICLVRPEYHAFFESAYVPICAFCVKNSPNKRYRTSFIDLSDFYGVDLQPVKTLEAIRDPSVPWVFCRCCSDFAVIPGSPFAFTVDDNVIASFADHRSVAEHGDTRKGMATGLNEEFVRAWSEVSFSQIGFGLSRREAQESRLKWFPYANGGQFRKWYGNYEDVVNWFDDGARLQTEKHESGRVRAVNLNLEYIFSEGISWTSISSSSLSVRTLPKGFLFSSAANAFFGRSENLKPILALLNSDLMSLFSSALNPTLNANPGDIGRIPVADDMLDKSGEYSQLVNEIIELTKRDWDSFETSWEFCQSPFLPAKSGTLTVQYENLRAAWSSALESLVALERDLNERLKTVYSIDTGPLRKNDASNITLTCNPVYRYDEDKSDSDLEALLLADTIREFISYAVGCMFGRYSLDKPGLILANHINRN